jgi:mannose-6-phosphate isomerase-like protein (cupin superfamily)
VTRLKVFKFDQLPTEALFDGKFTRTAIRSEHSIVMLNWLTPDYPRQLPHRHPFDQLSFVFAGTLIFEIGGERYEMPPMSAILVPPNALHMA